jgi:crossover junction endodeoxyribonuclease RuvC
MKILALDLSITETGWALAAGSERGCGLIVSKKQAGLHPMQRLDRIRRRVLELAAGADLVVLEGYSFGSKNSQAHALGELGGAVRLSLWGASIPYVEVPPSVVKKFATGKGNAGKEEVLVAAVRRLGYEGSNNNEADALWLLLAGLSSYGAGWVEMPKAQREALHTVAWPSLEGRS